MRKFPALALASLCLPNRSSGNGADTWLWLELTLPPLKNCVLTATTDWRSEQAAGKWLPALLWGEQGYQAWSIYQTAGELTCLLNRVGWFFFLFPSIQMRMESESHTAICWKGAAFHSSSGSPAQTTALTARIYCLTTFVRNKIQGFAATSPTINHPGSKI